MTEDHPSILIPRENRVNRAFAGVGAAIGLAVWFFLFSAPGGIASFVVSKSNPGLGTLVGFVGMLLAVPGVIWLAKSAWGPGWRRAFPLAPVGLGVLAWTVIGILALLSIEIAWIAALERTVGLPKMTDPRKVFGLLGVVLGAPITEEFLFRGYGLARIRELGGDRRALFLTAVVFAALHGSGLKLPGAFACGLFFGWIVLRTGSLWPALLGHFTINGGAFLLARFGSTTLPVHASWSWILVLGGVGVLILVLLFAPQLRARISELPPGS